MNVGDEKTQSLWMDTDVAPDAVALTRNERADTVVIGSGIAGLLARAAADYTRRQPALVFGFSSGINEEDIGL